MHLAELAAVADAVATTRSRSAKVRLLAECLAKLPAEERSAGAAWLAGVVPEGRLGIGPAAVQAVRGTVPAATSTLTIAAVAQRLAALRDIAGKGAAARREGALGDLFRLATGAEQHFLARLLLGELRQGALEGVMADALAAAANVPPAAVRRAIMLAGAVAPVAAAALGEGSAGLEAFTLRLYEPVSPMLASPADGVGSALASLGEAMLDYKLDGARVQVHKGDRGVRIYSRTGRDVTDSLPEIVARVAALPARRLVLDGEVLALEDGGRPRPFQETMRRFGRKLGVESAQTQLPLSLFAFDCLHADGQDLIDAPTADRARALGSALPADLIVPRIVTADVEQAERFLQSALALGHEGLLAKALDKPYEAGSRGAAWLKIKVAETLDLVVLAAEWGSGRRRGWLSNLHLGARDERGAFVMLGKTFKGLTDELLAWQTKELLARQVATDGYVVHVRPELVVEIAFNELQRSSRYPGGLALRFARVVRYRDDKTAADADTIATVRAIAARRPAAAAPR
jgi:DNA ligase-1